MVTQGKIKDRIGDTNWFLYALKLEGGKYYIGTAIDPQKRFLEHQEQGRNCAGWCKKHRAIEIIEISDTKTKRLFDAMVLEDLLTLKYIQQYGAENVNGGKYFGNSKTVERKSKNHLSRGFISIRHQLFEKFEITYQELKDLNIYEFVTDFNNSQYLYKLILEIENREKRKLIILDKITKAQHALI